MKRHLLLILSLLITISVLAQTETYTPAGKYKTNNNSANTNSAKTCGWFLQFLYPTYNPGEAGCESDGNYIYTVRWNLDLYYRYDVNGNYLATFTVPPTTAIRDLAYDGQYFYGSPASNTVYEMDFTPGSEALISQWNMPAGITVRSIAYVPPPTDAFYVSNWTGNEDWSLVSRDNGSGSGTLISAIPYSSHQVDGNYGLAYDDILPGGPYLWGLCQSFDPSLINWCHFVQVEVATGLQTGVWHDVNNDPQVNTNGSAGGCFIEALSSFPGTVTLGGNITNNAIFGYDLLSTIPTAWDVSPTDLISPINGNNLGVAEIIEVEIRNGGTNSVTSIPINYIIDGGTVVSETWSGNLASQTTATYTFLQTADFSTPGNYDVVVYTSMMPDMYLDNDTLHSIVSNTLGQYCIAGAAICNDEYIQQVQIGAIDNTSGNGCPLGYKNFKHIYVEITAGINEAITVTNGNPFSGDQCVVWVDYNMDGDFDDPFEHRTLYSNNGGLTFTGYLIPYNFNTVVDTSVMRIRLMYTGTPSPCGNASHGEVEDYSVILIPGTQWMFSCASGSSPEIEPCGLDWNGGCDMASPAYQDLFPGGETVCGTAWYDGTTRDTDWYRFFLTSSKIVTLKCDAEFEAIFGIIDINGGCTTAGWVNGDAFNYTTGICIDPWDSVQAALGPGEYVAYCAPDYAAAFACTDTMQYNLQFLVYNPPPPCDVVCPVGATSELEPCGDHWNDGCNMAVPAYQDIAFNETICGKGYISDTIRDTDWYKFTVNTNSQITYSVESEFVADVAIIDISDACGNEVILTYDNIDSCELVNISMQMGIGTYALFIGVDYGMYPSAPCGSKNDYVVTLTYNGPLTSYCDELYYFGCVNGKIDTFQLNTIINNGSSCGTNGYSDFTSMTTDLEAGLEYQLYVATNNNDEYVSMWIDFNDNYYFDPNEIIIEDFLAEAGNHIYTVPAIIPYTATPGSHRLRIRINHAASSADPCALYNYGEAEDYMVNITAPGPCNVVCPPNAIAELESCGSTTNNGCDMSVISPVYEDIHDNDIICGTVWFDGFFRDTDWYKFEVDYNTPITLKVKAEFDYEITFYDITSGCPAVLLDQELNYACNIGTISYFFYPGTYVAMIGPDVNGSTVNCINDNEYWLELDFVWDAPCIIDCPPTATMELEACGDSTNDGCNLQTPVFGNIANGEVICGTAWKNQLNRDTDWYLFTITETSDVSILGQSEFDCQVAIIDIPTCQSTKIMTAKNIDACTDYNVKYQGLSPGTYVAFIAPQAGDTMSCVNGYNHYKIELFVESPAWCHSSAIQAYDSKIDSVAFNTIANGSSGPNCRTYSDFSALSTDVKIGFTYPLTIQTGTCGNDHFKGVKIYIDWNADFDFYDPGEEVAAFGPDMTSTLYTANVTVPMSAESGATTRMRVVCHETTDMSLIDPCGEYPYGETEDYTINIVPRIVTYAGQTPGDTVSICEGDVVIPVMVDDFYNVAGISMKLNINPAILSYSTYQNVNPAIMGGSLVIGQVGATVIASWFAPFGEANIGSGLLLELVFNTTLGESSLVWDLSHPENCEYSDANLNIIASTWIDGFADIINCSTIEGIVSYADDAYTSTALYPMSNSTIYLMNNGIAIDTTITDNLGYYFFNVLQNGTYTLVSETPIGWGGGNSADALAIMLHFSSLSLLSGINLIAGDVDTSGFVSTLDALYVAQRFVGMISSFPAGDWYFETPQAIVDGTAPVNIDYNAICYGDVDGSYNVPFLKMSPSVTLNTLGVKEIKANEEFKLPIFVTNSMELGAISLVLDYPENKVSLLDVFIDADDNNLLFNAKDGKLRLAWYNLNPMQLSANDAMITLKLKAKESVDNASFRLDDASELNDRYSNKIYNARLYMPRLTDGPDATTNYSLSYNYSNPFNNTAEIIYALPEEGYVSLKVFNLLGEQISVLVEALQGPGVYRLEFNGSGLTAGIYLYKIDVKGKTRNFVETKRMVITNR